MSVQWHIDTALEIYDNLTLSMGISCRKHNMAGFKHSNKLLLLSNTFMTVVMHN